MRPRISESMEESIESIVESGKYETKSEFVRDAIRRRISECT